MKTNRVVIVQCRLSSTRLPGKALKKLGDKSILAWTLNSMHKVKADRYFVATDTASYQELLPICKDCDFECFAGDLQDVLKRFVDLLNTIDCKTVIRATADNPFLFFEAAQESVELFEEKNKGKEKCDYLTYTGLPHGSGVEIISAQALKKAITETNDPYDHEHVGPALYNHKENYKCEFITAPRRYNYPELRTTIDTFSDYLRACGIYNFLKKEEAPYTADLIVEACNSWEVENPIVLIPSLVKGHGTGHLRRCLSTAISNNFFVYIPKNRSLKECDSILEEYLSKGLEASQIIEQVPDASYKPVIITDSFELTEEEAVSYKNAKALISIDEGSQYTDYCDYLLDIIPPFKLNRKSNIFDSSLIEKSNNKRTDKKSAENFSNILICLGGEDPAALSLPAINTFSKLYPNAKITALLSKEVGQLPSNVEYKKNISGLKDHIYEYDLVVSHYGLTAYEAAYAGCAIILLPTSKLHLNLAKKYNFAYIADKNISEASVRNALQSINLYPELSIESESKKLGDTIKFLSKGQRLLCPVCGKVHAKPDQIVSRNDRRTYRRCQSCGMVYMSYTIEEDKKYQKAYFFEDYKKQYGKTYEEDFEYIKSQGLRRVEVIKSVIGNLDDKNILDIGCAYGPFLSAANDFKLNPFGTDISEDAITYVQNKLKYPATVSAFPQLDTEKEFGIPQFDIVTMWYVIEHFKDLDSVLSKISRIVKFDGVFAFSTPSGEGVSAKSDIDHFYSISPSDHYSIWEPTKADKILRKYGFRVEKIVSTGHHPERFPSIKKSGAKAGSLKWKLIDKYSHINGLGDTMEIYCKKFK
ncbi:MAG: methyltransferase domain-containing protein [Treponema sp.]|nr:methyltransferase domain-containing protein [Treponema sp.]